MSAVNPARVLSTHAACAPYPAQERGQSHPRSIAGTAFLHPIASGVNPQTSSLANLSGEDAAQRDPPFPALGGKHHSAVLA